MEAGAAAGPGTATAAPGAGGESEALQGQPGQQQQEQQQSQQPDIGQQLQQFQGSVSDQLEQMREWMESQAPQQQQDPGQQEPQQPDFGYMDPSDPQYSPDQAAQMLLQQLQQENDRALEQRIAPLQQEVQDMRFQRDADALAAQFPELQNQEKADSLMQTTHEWVQAAGLPVEQAANPQVIRAVYMMGRAAELANDEAASETPGAASLEGAGGASPGGAQAGSITAESILGGGGRNPLPFG